jgi:hypothetical protein
MLERRYDVVGRALLSSFVPMSFTSSFVAMVTLLMQDGRDM